MHKDIKVVCFDADDTLWENEPFYREAEQHFAQLMASWVDRETCDKELLKTEIANLSLYGYGAKSFVLSMLETAINLSNHALPVSTIGKILQLGRDLINAPLRLLSGVEEILEFLQDKYRLIVATKGDLLDQERKLANSNLEKYFHHIEIMSEKDTANYLKLIKHLDIKANQFLMIGNSLKSDILPVLKIGGNAIHIPCATTWAHEHVEDFQGDSENYREIKDLTQIIDLFDSFL